MLFVTLNKIPQLVKLLLFSQKKQQHFFFPLARAGLHNEDRLIEVNDENVTQRSHRGLTKTQQKNLSFIFYLFFIFQMLLL